jgi:hypothetical protein
VVIGYKASYGGYRGGGQNTIVGSYAVHCTFDYSPATGSLVEVADTTAIGAHVLYGANSGCKLYESLADTYVGKSAGYYIIRSSFNVGIGRGALMGDSGGGSTFSRCNVAIGAYAGKNIRCGKNNILIGHCVCTTNYNCCHQIIIGNSAHTTGYLNSSTFSFSGSVSKSAGSFRIIHPNPAKSDTKDLWHSFVESPNEGDNIYRYSVDTTNCRYVIELPDYYPHLNKNDQVWVSPVGHFGAAYGAVTEDQKCTVVCTNADGCYNVLLIGTRKDPAALEAWNGYERDICDFSPNTKFDEALDKHVRFDPETEADMSGTEDMDI